MRLEGEHKDVGVVEVIALSPHRDIVKRTKHIALSREPNNRNVPLAFDLVKPPLFGELIDCAVVDDCRICLARPLFEGVDTIRHEMLLSSF